MNILTRARVPVWPRPRATSDRPPEAALTPGAVQRGLRLSIVEGALSTVHINVTTGAFVTGFALLLGASDFELGLLGALPFIGQLFQFVGAYLEERLGTRRRLVVLTAAASRSLWALIALLPFLGGLGAARLSIFLLVLVIAQALIGIAGNAWMSWMSDLVPPQQRGRYFGVRNTVASISAMASVWLAGRVLDSYRGAGAEPLGYALIFGAGVACAIAGALVLSRQPEPPLQRRARVRLRQLFGAPLRHRSFRAFSLASAGWALATGVSAPFFNAYGIQDLKLSFSTLALMGVVTSCVTLISQPLIGRLQDRYGDRRVLIGSVIGVVLLPLAWVVARPGLLLPLWLNAIGAGIFWPGITQGLVNLLMERAPAEGRGAYVAAYGAISGAGTLVAGLLGGALASAVGTDLGSFGPLVLNHYTLLFIISSLGRAAMVFVFARRL